MTHSKPFVPALDFQYSECRSSKDTNYLSTEASKNGLWSSIKSMSSIDSFFYAHGYG